MRKPAVVLLFIGLFCLSVFAQANRKTRPRIVKTPTPTPTPQINKKPPVLRNDTVTPNPDIRKPPVLVDNTSKKPPSTNNQTPEEEILEDDDEIIKIDTSFVTLPVTVLDRQGRFISGLTQRQFKVFENGKEQRIEYFASVEQPFTVVLMIDVSPSTQYRIDEIQNAAITFVNQLRANDKVLVTSFDRRLRMLTQKPTTDRIEMRNAIRRASFGDGTSLYDSVDKVINEHLRNISGRKAIVLFTDGVDTTSRNADYQSTLRKVEEIDALMYPIRYDTSAQYSRRRVPRRIPRRTGNILGDILGAIITGRGGTISVGGAGQSPEEYARGKAYLEELARYSGGRKFEANTTYNLDAAFRSIAEELRRQYSLGYYPEAVGERGERKQIRVRVMRPNLVVRTKRSYIVGGR